MKEKIKEAIEIGKGTDWNWEGEEEIEYQVFDSDIATNEVMGIVKQMLQDAWVSSQEHQYNNTGISFETWFNNYETIS